MHRVPTKCLSRTVTKIIKDLFKKTFIYLFWDREEGREKERERNISVRDTSILGTCPDWESNQRPFCSRAGTQSTEPHQPGLKLVKVLKNHVLTQMTGKTGNVWPGELDIKRTTEATFKYVKSYLCNPRNGSLKKLKNTTGSDFLSKLGRISPTLQK